MARAVAYVDLDAVAGNVAALRRAAPDSQLMAVVKADAYGHGVERVAPAARAAGADWLGVALPAEATALRAAGDRGPLMAWLFTPGEDLTSAIAGDVDLSASAPWAVAEVAAAAQRVGRRARLHLKVDTGLGRSGAVPADWPMLIEAARAARRDVEVVGIWSHLSNADDADKTVNDEQRLVFGQALEQAAALGIEPQLRHLGSSGAALRDPDCHYDLVRCGIAVYGLTPGPGLGTSEDLGLQPVMSVVAEVAHVKRVPAGHAVSYGRRYLTQRPSTLVLVPAGYADGVPRAGSGRLQVSINGRRHTVAGTIAMDQFVLDVGDAEVSPGDTVTLFGSGGDTPTADDWAAACGTINYEIVTRLGRRIPREYVGGPHAPA